MNFQLTLDPQNADDIDAAIATLTVLKDGLEEKPKPAKKPRTSNSSKKEEAPAEKKEEAPAEKKEEAPAEKKEEAPAEKKEEAPAESNKVELSDLRKLVPEKAKIDRDAVVAELAKYDAKNVAQLHEKHYQAFYDFLIELK